MSKTEEVCNFKPGDVVVIKEDERNIELIPAGIPIMLSQKNDEETWWGSVKISGVPRSLLVYTNNLEHAFK